MAMNKSLLSLCAVTALLTTAATVNAAPINVLWTSGSERYNANVQELASEAPTFDPGSNGSNTWSLTLWDYTIDPSPDFAAYDALVIGSTDFGGDNNFFSLGVKPDGVLANKGAISAARGSRTFLSGQDADWHDLNNRQDQDDGPKGFLINAVNWAASGTGLGIVSMTDGYPGEPNGWWLDDDSFLQSELTGSVQYFNDESVFLGTGQESFPINEGLTSSGLSNWSTSSHAGFTPGITGYVPINFEGPNSSGRAITIVTAGQERGGTTPGGTTPEIPVPATMFLFLVGLVSLAMASRKTSTK